VTNARSGKPFRIPKCIEDLMHTEPSATRQFMTECGAACERDELLPSDRELLARLVAIVRGLAAQRQYVYASSARLASAPPGGGNAVEQLLTFAKQIEDRLLH
jgi:hypothetical protein